jgi:hypothetical protein
MFERSDDGTGSMKIVLSRGQRFTLAMEQTIQDFENVPDQTIAQAKQDIMFRAAGVIPTELTSNRNDKEWSIEPRPKSQHGPTGLRLFGPIYRESGPGEKREGHSTWTFDLFFDNDGILSQVLTGRQDAPPMEQRALDMLYKVERMQNQVIAVTGWHETDGEKIAPINYESEWHRTDKMKDFVIALKESLVKLYSFEKDGVLYYAENLPVDCVFDDTNMSLPVGPDPWVRLARVEHRALLLREYIYSFCDEVRVH